MNDHLPAEDNQQQESVGEQFLVLTILASSAVDISEMEEISINDHELSSVKESLRTGVWGNPNIKQYQPFQNELGIVGELVIRGDKLVVPVSLRDRFIQLGHEGHPGESGMTRRLRDRV